MDKVYLSLNQGVSYLDDDKISDKLKKVKLEEITDKLKENIFKNVSLNKNFTTNRIDIGAKTKIPIRYALSHIIGKEYKAETLPNNEVLLDDLKYAIKVYRSFTDFLYKNDNNSKSINNKILKGTFFNDNNEYLKILKEDFKDRNGEKSMAKNMILYGPPGTGKTFNAINKALEIVASEKYQEMINNNANRKDIIELFNNFLNLGQICFCTFHQSYSYEDFIEGLRCDEKGNFKPEGGVFKQLCEAASQKEEKLSSYEFNENDISFHKMSLGDTNNSSEDSIFEYCIQHECVALGWGGDIDYSHCKNIEDIKREFRKEEPNAKNSDFNITAINRFIVNMKKNDIIIITYGNRNARAIAKIVSDYYYEPNSEIGFSHFRKVQWLYKSEVIEVERILKDKFFSQQAIYSFDKNDLNISSIKDILSIKEGISEEKNYVLIIDEINRGNISKIFGELITLIEEDKRIGCENEIKVTLPYSRIKFGVPNNVYILGTMNTADRSIALLDTALRRRFEFKEYMPKLELLPEDVDGINLKKFVEKINDRIEVLFDRDHSIGQAYFMQEGLTFDKLVSIMKNKVIPLIKEYFYEDYEKIELILGGAAKDKSNDYFLAKEVVNSKKLFGKNISVDEYEKIYKYKLVEEPTKKAFTRIYEDADIEE